MRRFFHSVARHVLLIIGLLLALTFVPVQKIALWALQQLVATEWGQSASKATLSFFSDHPQALAPTLLVLGLFLIFGYCLYESHFSGKPLLKVSGIPMKSIGYIQAEDGGRKVVGTIGIFVENVTQGTGQEATADN